MNAMVSIAMYGWIAACLGLFLVLPKRRAVLISMIGGWLFLPIASFDIPLFPNYDKFTAVCGATFLAALITDSGCLFSIRLRWYDLPILVWVLVPFASSMSNGLGEYDGLSAVFTHLVRYGFPYWIGRAYFNDREGLRELLVGLIVGGMVYVPLSLIEIRLSPNLHYWVYGYHQIPSHMTKRLGGYRPVVFLKHGLELGLFMANAAIAAWWCWRTKIVRWIWGVPIQWVAIGLMVVTVMCRSLNSYIIGVVCFVVLLLLERMKMRVALLVLAMVPVVFVTLRAGVGWEAEWFVRFVSTEIDSDRAVSMKSRIDNEQRMLGHDWQRPVFGWGGWNRNRPDDELAYKGEKAITDSWWIIAFGTNGLVGLISLGVVLILPALVVFGRNRGMAPVSPEVAAGIVLSVIVLGFAIDSLANAMVSPIYFTIIGGVCGQVRRRAAQVRMGLSSTSIPVPSVAGGML